MAAGELPAARCCTWPDAAHRPGLDDDRARWLAFFQRVGEQVALPVHRGDLALLPRHDERRVDALLNYHARRRQRHVYGADGPHPRGRVGSIPHPPFPCPVFLC